MMNPMKRSEMSYSLRSGLDIGSIASPPNILMQMLNGAQLQSLLASTSDAR